MSDAAEEVRGGAGSPGPETMYTGAVSATPLDQIARANPGYVDSLYRRWVEDRSAVDPRWAAFFAGFELGYERPRLPPAEGRGGEGAAPPQGPGLMPGVFHLVHTYREVGHCVARLDPLEDRDAPRCSHDLIEEARARFRPEDLDRVLDGSRLLHGAPPRLAIRELLARLEATYCGTLGVQCLEIHDKAQREWIQERVEPTLGRPRLTRAERLEVLRRLVEAQELERFIQARYVGHKRFSVEGSDALLPVLDTAVEDAAGLGVRELILGMAHRGRLNVLAHILRKPLEQIFAEFEDAPPQDPTAPGDVGDVKYHLGWSHDHVTRGGRPIHLSLSPNPSHLEHIYPVILGIVRGKQDRQGDRDRRAVVPLVIHGDAAFTGQGVVPEAMALSQLEPYRTGGTVHVIIDNRIGFTATPADYRPTPYASDLARSVHAPVFHVNADDPEAAVLAARLAIGFRQRFAKDVVIDLIGYRRHGHNEGDDPSFTQPVLYRKIAAHETARALYEARLIEEGAVDRAVAERLAAEARDRLEAALSEARRRRPKPAILTLGGAWTGLERAGRDRGADTRVERATLERIARAYATPPPGFTLHPKVGKLAGARLRAVADPDGRIDWATAEMLAFGSLVLEGTRVRLAGQDSRRGTFSQRHSVLFDHETGEPHVPLAHLDPGQAPFEPIDTMLSEAGVLAFEYGVSWADPFALVVWEAQFGDFANVAQAMIDVFLAAAEEKWHRMSGLTLLLPHGYEGQGPEHSSARLERFLQLAAEENIQVVHPTTPAQLFHVLRRQTRRRFRKPLVVLTPKSLLRHERAVSRPDDLASGGFRPVIEDPEGPREARRVVLVSGKLGYALERAREERGVDDVAIVRVEELYPFPADAIRTALEAHGAAPGVVWAQEEPWNMGAWHFVEARREEWLPEGRTLRYVGRPESAAPATGSLAVHRAEEAAILDAALERD